MISQKWNRKEEITSTGKYRNCWIKWYKNTQVAQISETFLFFSTKYITGEPEPEWHRVCLVFTWLPLQCVWLSIKKCFPPAYAKIQWQSHFLCITLFLALDTEDYFMKDLSVCGENVSLMEFIEGKCCLFFLFISLNNFSYRRCYNEECREIAGS